MSREEIFNLVTALGELGISKVRITGGEPMVRHDLIDIINDIRNISNIKTIALTTNGYKLEKYGNVLINSGVNALNVSVDSLKADNFKTITGHDKFNSVFAGITNIAQNSAIKLKLNAVLLKGLNDDELPLFLNLIKNNDIVIRFIELMRTGDNQEYFSKYHLDPQIILDQIENMGFKKIARQFNQGPANEYVHDEYKGKIGIIAPYSKDFCATCNRLRISARGALRLCLFGDGGVNLRPLLSDKKTKPQLQDLILNSLKIKPQAHDLIGGYTGTTKHLAQIGG